MGLPEPSSEKDCAQRLTASEVMALNNPSTAIVPANSAQRLTASEVMAHPMTEISTTPLMCSTPYGIRGNGTCIFAQNPKTRTIVLNALRHQR